jgi:hypothetical protein
MKPSWLQMAMKINMPNPTRGIILIQILIFSVLFSFSLAAQSWKFVKDKDGIKLYTSEEAGKALKAYRGITDIAAPAEKIFTLIEDVNNTAWWDKNLSEIKVLLYEKNKRAQYYLVFDLPWPVTDRDLCVDVNVTIDQATGERKIVAFPLLGVIPERKDRVRIKDYRQTWTVTPAGKDLSHVVLDGFVDPAGSVPDWITNMLIVDSPFKSISGVKQQIAKSAKKL